jgi:hypothetical protein
MAGVAPFDNNSGKTSLPRHIEAGRAAVRKALYMAALTAIRHNRIMKSYAERLRRNGKCAKVVITAVMRKLIVTLNAYSAPANLGVTHLTVKTVDTLAQDPTPPFRGFSLATPRRSIHFGSLSRRCRKGRRISALGP